jgi:pimeloyl-ACP methyl ester carboxylesterase
VARFGDRRPVVALDLPGHGRTDKPRRGYGLAEMALEVAAAAERLGASPAVWVGHSLGSMVALTVALIRPEAVGGLVLVAPPAAGRPPAWLRLFLAGPGSTRLLDVRRALYGLAGRSAPRAGGGRVGAALRRARSAGFVRGDVQAATAQAAFSLRAPIEALDVPALVVGGALDLTSPVGAAREIAARMPRARLVVMPGAGHHPMDERPVQFYGLLADWLDELER